MNLFFRSGFDKLQAEGLVATRIQSLTLVGLRAHPVTVEVDLAPGLPSFAIVGLPDKAVDEARERVRAAIKNAGFQFPTHRITVNLAPADIPKIGPGFDLPIALAVLAAHGVVRSERLKNLWVVGELSLTGETRAVTGVLPMSLLLKSEPEALFVVPTTNLAEATLVGGIRCVGVNDLHEIVSQLHQPSELPIAERTSQPPVDTAQLQDVDFAAISGLDQIKRVLEIAASGHHNVLLMGPPGTGKTLLARAFVSILPELSEDQHLETLTIRSAAGLLDTRDVHQRTPPVRTPHHTASQVAIVGGGSRLRPGEVSLAHRGVLFLDELPEFSRSVLEALREPLEDGKITIARAQGASTFPAQFLLLAAANPCPCGYLGDQEKPCQCPPRDILRYQRKLSGPLLDRIDLVVSVPRQKADLLLDQPSGIASGVIRARVIQARERQYSRHQSERLNGSLIPRQIKEWIQLSDAGRALLLKADQQLHLSGRSLHRLLKVSRTIADLAQAEQVDAPHVGEALQYRQASLSGEVT